MTRAYRPLPCPPCEDAAGHQYDDDRHCILYGIDGPWSKIGDPCMWCDHEKCEGCGPPRGASFAVEHEAGREDCWDPACPRCGERARAAWDDGSCDLDSVIAEFSGKHPWLWRKQRAKSTWQAFIGKRLPLLCRHNGTTGPVDGDHGWCLWCGRKVPWATAANSDPAP